MTIDFSNPDLPMISLVITKEVLREIVADPNDGYLRISRHKIVEAIEANETDVFKKFEALQYVPGFTN
jgi:hypothetical protein